ncbi:MAG: SOS response-associated peptidase family protein [Eggerthellaceae bacterium]|nr:SOS response-associated peptidase family protein [Eggerthellaceae bacterium]
MCGRFVVLTRDEVSRAVAAVEARHARLGKLVAGGSARVQANYPGHETFANRDRATSVEQALADATQLPSIERALADGRAQAFPGSVIPAFSQAGVLEANGAALMGASPAGSLEIADCIWGFSVDWQKQSVFNTRLESALSGSGMWAGPMERGRCVVPVLAFYEPHATETVVSARSGKSVKRPYVFWQPSTVGQGVEPLMIAAVCSDGRCSLVTTEPNAHVAPVHKRMPLILRFEEVPVWLEGDSRDVAELADRSAVGLSVCPEDELLPREEPAQLQLDL